MAEIHDNVTDQSTQAQTYSSIEVSLFNTLLNIEGASTVSDALQGGSILRIADCSVKPEQQTHFIQMQKDVWNIGMANAGGMLGGSQHIEVANHYLVTTLWRNLAAHQNYAENHLLTLRQKADVSNDLEHITGHLVALEPAWRVLP